MPPPLVALDTSILLAIGFGPDSDPRAPLALQAVELLRANGNKLLIVDSVIKEVEEKLAKITVIEKLMKEACTEVIKSGKSGAPIPGILELEMIFVNIRKGSSGKSLEKYVQAVEHVMLTIAQRHNPPHAFAWLALAFMEIEAVRAGVETRIKALGAEICGQPKSHNTPVDLPNARSDSMHLAQCGVIAKERKCGVLFLFFDSGLYANKSVAEPAYPGVRLCSPTYLSAYASQDASAWLDDLKGLPTVPAP